METCTRHYPGVFVFREDLVTRGICPVCAEIDNLSKRVIFFQDQGRIGELVQKLKEVKEEMTVGPTISNSSSRLK